MNAHMISIKEALDRIDAVLEDDRLSLRMSPSVEGITKFGHFYLVADWNEWDSDFAVSEGDWSSQSVLDTHIDPTQLGRKLGVLGEDEKVEEPLSADDFPDEVKCDAAIETARSLVDELEVTSEFPESEFHPYFPIFAATFRHECTNYDVLLRQLPGQVILWHLELIGGDPGPDWLLCTCDFEGGCLNHERAHDILKNAAGELGGPIYQRMREEAG